MNRFFTVPGEPQGKGRPRFVKGRAYTPPKTKAYEDRVRICYTRACGSEPPYPAGVPLSVIINADFPVPESTPKKNIPQMLSGEILPTKKPDCDNIIKVILDSLNGIAYHDDSQVVRVHCNKFYGTEAKVEVAIGRYKEVYDDEENSDVDQVHV